MSPDPSPAAGSRPEMFVALIDGAGKGYTAVRVTFDPDRGNILQYGNDPAKPAQNIAHPGMLREVAEEIRRALEVAILEAVHGGLRAEVPR